MSRRPGRADLTDVLLTTGALAGPAFVATFLAEGARRPGYDPRRHPVSSLSLGPGGWLQVANFLVTGAAHLGCSVGLLRARRRAPEAVSTAAAALVGVHGVGLIGAGLFAADPISGYPPGASPAGTGALHDRLSALVFLGIPGAALATAGRAWRQGERGWAGASAVTAGLVLAGVVQFGRGFGQDPRVVDVAGVYQRLTIGLGLGWISALALRARSR